MISLLKNTFLNNLKSASFYGVLVIFIVILWANFNIKRWKESNVIDWDVTSYYAYLPAAYIHGDISLHFTDGKETEYNNKHQFWHLVAPNGGKVIKTTMGLAILYAPFFILAHNVAIVEGAETDGFSEPYEKLIHLSSLFYLVIGLFFLRKILLAYFHEVVVMITLIAVTIGTNLFYYSTTEAAMSHAYNFSLFAIFIYLSLKWHDQQKIITSIFVGLIGGLIVLIRPVNILIFILPFLYEVKSYNELKAKLIFFLRQWKHLLIIGGCSFLILLPQLIYWKYITGHFFFNSYIGERFYFSNPHILEGLFSYRKGWLLYTPIMIFAVIGFVFLYKNYKKLFWPIFLFFIINIYVLFCWWAWWYGGGFGLRAMIDSYSLLAIPFAATFQFFYEKRNKIGFYSITIVGFVLLGFNLFQTAQYRSGAIHWDGMTKESYWASFGVLEIKDPHYWELIKSPDYDAAREGKDEYDFNPF